MRYFEKNPCLRRLPSDCVLITTFFTLKTEKTISFACRARLQRKLTKFFNLCFQKLIYVMGVSFFLLFTLAAVLSSAEAGAKQNR
jgi:hypothetical protein